MRSQSGIRFSLTFYCVRVIKFIGPTAPWSLGAGRGYLLLSYQYGTRGFQKTKTKITPIPVDGRDRSNRSFAAVARTENQKLFFRTTRKCTNEQYPDTIHACVAWFVRCSVISLLRGRVTDGTII